MMRRASRVALILAAGCLPLLAPGSAAAGPSDGSSSAAPVDRRTVLPPLTLQTTFSPSTVSAPGPLAYTLVATNNGNETLTGTTIVDEVTGAAALTCIPAMPATLLAGESLTCTTTRAVTQTDVDYGLVIHVATAYAERPGGDPNDDTDDLTAITDAVVDIAHRPRLTVTAATVTGRYRKGKSVPIRLTVRNSGNVTLNRLAFGANLRSPKCGSPDVRTLAPGAALSCRAGYKVTASDARKGRAAVAVAARTERPFGRTDTTSDDVIARATVRVSVVKKK